MSQAQVEQIAWDYVGARPQPESMAKPFDSYPAIKAVGDLANKGVTALSVADAVPAFSLYSASKGGAGYLSALTNSGASTAHTWSIGKYAPNSRGVVGSYSGLQSVSSVLKTSTKVAGHAGTVLSRLSLEFENLPNDNIQISAE
ncbi:hypothetical protein [Vibrio sp. 99-70-13A1]|uniref:hypothetical protein n=1 Tax=Vibrio sp. 99-70-13A1 TaxID=2607601 RepID=UPI001493946A|nr:hypothetical protein [Vibrio sp. 99-70-13A1]NOH98122.1 hypothetical protein [Vibrio sp. 99-70-13A1]